MITHIRRVGYILLIKWWSWRFRKQCSSAGHDLSVLGPCEVSGEGTIVVGNGLVIRSRTFNRVEISVAAAARLELGNRVFLNQGVRIACCVGITIGDNTLIGDETVILDNDYHGVGGSSAKTAPVCIESDVWIATRVIVLRGVTIGQGSAIGAGSVVTKSIPPRVFAAGVPARVIKAI
jgi:acetyltransferase-like isoleucine patch superfamily enzyme